MTARTPTMIGLCALLAACGPDFTWQGGTGVGNPGSARAAVHPGKDLVIEDALLPLDAWRVLRCDGTSERVEVGAEIDLLDASAAEIPGGELCGLELAPGGPVVLAGIAGDGSNPGKGTFEAILDIGPVLLRTAPFVLDADGLIVELGHGGWLDASALGLEDGTHTFIDAIDTPELHDDLVTDLEDGSALVLDGDRDGEVDPDERDAALATGPLHTTEDDDDP